MEPAKRIRPGAEDTFDFDHIFGTLKVTPGRVVDEEYKPDLSALSKLDQRLLIETIARACERTHRLGYVVGSTPIPEDSPWSHEEIHRHFLHAPLDQSMGFFHVGTPKETCPRFWASLNRLRRFNPELCKLFNLDRED